MKLICVSLLFVQSAVHLFLDREQLPFQLSPAPREVERGIAQRLLPGLLESLTVTRQLRELYERSGRPGDLKRAAELRKEEDQIKDDIGHLRQGRLPPSWGSRP